MVSCFLEDITNVKAVHEKRNITDNFLYHPNEV
jgi:hypothetical protein